MIAQDKKYIDYWYNDLLKKIRRKQISYTNTSLSGPANNALGVDSSTGDIYYKDSSGDWQVANAGGGGGTTNAGVLTSGTLNDARLSANVVLSEVVNTFALISASTHIRLIYVISDETNNGDSSLYFYNGTTLNSTALAATINALTRQSILGYKNYTVTLTQSGTSAPVATTLDDMVTGVTIARTAAGTYNFTKTSAWVSGKTIPFEEVITDFLGNLYRINWVSVDVIQVRTYAVADISILADNVLSNFFLNIKIYN